MINYQLGKIYKIVCNTTGLEYIGSTCQPTLAMRLSKHKGAYKSYLKGNPKTHYISSFKVLECNDYDIVLLESYPCASKDELHQRERFYIEHNVCVNMVIPKRTIKEWKEEHKESVRESNLKYKRENKDKSSKVIQCDCGGSYTNYRAPRHYQSEKHQYYVAVYQ